MLECKQTGHNRTSCDRRSAANPPTTAPPARAPAAPPIARAPRPHFVAPVAASVAISSTQQSRNNISKRKLPMTLGSQDSVGTSGSRKKVCANSQGFTLLTVLSTLTYTVSL